MTNLERLYKYLKENNIDINLFMYLLENTNIEDIK